MTEQEFLKKRIPIWLEGDDLHISTPSSDRDRSDMHAMLCKKYNYNWMFSIRGYYWPGSHVILYIGDYEMPNCTVMVASYLFSYFKDIKYVGFGCDKGEIGEIWQPKLLITRDTSLMLNDLSSKQPD